MEKTTLKHQCAKRESLHWFEYRKNKAPFPSMAAHIATHLLHILQPSRMIVTCETASSCDPKQLDWRPDTATKAQKDNHGIVAVREYATHLFD
jgi:hypothetical protein